MLNPNVWQDPDFGRLSSEAKVMFFGLISNADDEGRLRGHVAYLKSIIFVYDDYPAKKVEKIRNEVISIMKNVVLYTVENEEYIQLKNWDKYQKQRDDRVVPSDFPSVRSGQVADISPTNDGQVPAEVKLSKLVEVKLREDKEVFGEFENVFLTRIELEKLKTSLGEKNTSILINELSGYIKSLGKDKYKDHYATLINWARRKFTENLSKSKGKQIV
jgi:hypothetical protein